MRRIFLLLLFAFIGYVGWRIGGGLSSDAISMAIGVFFGIVAGIPTALLLLASNHRHRGRDQASSRRDRGGNGRSPYGGQGYGPAGYGPQPPVIVIAGNGPPGQYPAGGQPHPQAGAVQPYAGWGPGRPERKFKVVGEQEEWVDEW